MNTNKFEEQVPFFKIVFFSYFFSSADFPTCSLSVLFPFFLFFLIFTWSSSSCILFSCNISQIEENIPRKLDLRKRNLSPSVKGFFKRKKLLFEFKFLNKIVACLFKFSSVRLHTLFKWNKEAKLEKYNKNWNWIYSMKLETRSISYFWVFVKFFT